MDIAKTLFWIGHASFYVKAKGQTIFIDPFNLGAEIKEKADLILITHAHADHCDKGSVSKIMKPGTEVMGPADCLENLGIKDGKAVKPGHSEIWREISVSTVPAYNNKSGRENFHPKRNGWVGWVLNVGTFGSDDFIIYHGGDTDFIDEMKGFARYGIGASLLPIGGTYTMDVEEAIEAQKSIGAKHAVPMHYKNLLGREGSEKAEARFRQALPNAFVMKEVQPQTFRF
jgi:L-ascorbate metabolism protein UlaG (beta-lactamase superfamily)